MMTLGNMREKMRSPEVRVNLLGVVASLAVAIARHGMKFWSSIGDCLTLWFINWIALQVICFISFFAIFWRFNFFMGYENKTSGRDHYFETKYYVFMIMLVIAVGAIIGRNLPPLDDYD